MRHIRNDMARLKGTTELNINPPKLLEGNTLDEVRNELEKIKFENGITVLALQPEVGKTESFIRYCEANKDKTIAYFAPTHDLLYEVEKRIKDKMPSANVIHWFGVSKACERYLKDRISKTEEPYVKILYDNHLNVRYFCESCKVNPCEYKNQFIYDKPAIVLAPLEYIGTHDFDAVFVDELATKCDDFSWTLEESEVNHAIQILKGFEDLPILNDFATVTSNPNHLSEIDKEVLEDIFKNGIKKSIGNLDDFKLLAKVLSNVRKSSDFLEWKKIYQKSDGYEKSLDTYYRPKLYTLFKLAQSIPVVLMDATFNDELFTDLLNGYDGEFRIKKSLNISIYKSQVRNEKSVIYKVNPDSWYPKASVIHKGKYAKAIEQVKALHNQYVEMGKKVGIITFKDIEEASFEGFETLHYGDLRGQNKFEKFDILILLGTYQINPKGIVQQHNQLYLTDLKESVTSREFESFEEAILWDETKDPKYGKDVEGVDPCVANLKDNYNRPIVESWNECYFDWSRPRIEIIWLILKTVTPRESDIEWIKTADVSRLSDDAIGLNNGRHTLIIELSEEKEKVTFEMDYKRTLEFPAERVEGGLRISLPIQKPEYPYPDKRRKYCRVKKSRGANDSEPIKSDLIEKITREDELYQAIYRIRPFNEKMPKKIYVWGIVPEEIKAELQYDEIDDIDDHIEKLRQKSLEIYDPEKHFAEGKRISKVVEDISNDTGCTVYKAGKIFAEHLDKSNVWKKEKKTITGSFKPVDMLVKKV